MTPEVALPGLRREHAVRIPDGALPFHPPPEVLNRLGESETPAPGAATVWEFDGKRLTTIPVRAGLAGEGWTELLSGPIRSGDALVTSASCSIDPGYERSTRDSRMRLTTTGRAGAVHPRCFRATQPTGCGSAYSGR